MNESASSSPLVRQRRFDPQLFRFCVYGFLKNQQYFDPFLILAFREKGLSFAAIGGLVAFRSICVNLLEIPSGAAADVWGRRRCMIVSMMSYAFSFAVFGLARSYPLFFAAMFMFAVGEAFRTGTHKAMIFDWLTRQGRKNEKTRIYGFTRSWSKIGSALNVVIAALVVIFTDSYQWIFWISIVPYLLNIVNFLFYPAYLDESSVGSESTQGVWHTLRGAFVLTLSRRGLRALVLEGICFEGIYSTLKDYLQPLVKATALAMPVLLASPERHRTAILMALVYAILNLLGSVASRESHRAAQWCGGEVALNRRIWHVTIFLYVLSVVGMFTAQGTLPILGFVIVGVLLNIWKPVFLSRFYDRAPGETAATTLSIANQSKTLSVAVLAPLLGMAVDAVSAKHGTLYGLWPVGMVGLIAAIVGLALAGRTPVNTESDDGATGDA